MASGYLIHKKRGETLLGDDEREELMMTRRGSPSPAPEDRSELHSSLQDDSKPSSSISSQDTWNFVLLVVLCKMAIHDHTHHFLQGDPNWKKNSPRLPTI